MSRVRRWFRPEAAGLEGRELFSTGFGPIAPSERDASTVPTPNLLGAPYVPPAAWMSLHQEYAARARQKSDPVVVLGDSLVYLWGDPRRKARPGLPLQPYGTSSWDATLGADRAANFGIVGDWTQNLLWRVENGELAGRPRVAVVLVGVDNLLGGETAAQTAAGVAAVVKAIRTVSPSTTVLVLGLPPSSSDPSSPLRTAERDVNARLAGLVGDKVAYLNPGAAFLNADGTLIPGFVQPVGVHLTGQGYRVLGSMVQPTVRTLLAGSRGRRG